MTEQLVSSTGLSIQEIIIGTLAVLALIMSIVALVKGGSEGPIGATGTTGLTGLTGQQGADGENATCGEGVQCVTEEELQTAVAVELSRAQSVEAELQTAVAACIMDDSSIELELPGCDPELNGAEGNLLSGCRAGNGTIKMGTSNGSNTKWRVSTA